MTGRASTVMTLQQTTQFLKQAKNVSVLDLPAPDTAQCFRKVLEFYPKSELVEIKIPNQTLYFLSGPAGVLPLEYTDNPLAHINTTFGLNLTKETVAAYVFLYMQFFRQPEGVIKIIDTVNDLHFREDMSPQQRKLLVQRIERLTVTDYNQSGYNLSGTILFGTNLFKMQFQVTQTGIVNITKDALIFSDLPVFDTDLNL